MSETFCDKCGGGPFDGWHGLQVHTSLVHGCEVEPEARNAECCRGVYDKTPRTRRRWCETCGRILDGNRGQTA